MGLGYNVEIAEAIEMINQAFISRPEDSFNVGVSTGLIATIP